MNGKPVNTITEGNENKIIQTNNFDKKMKCIQKESIKLKIN